jgi:hypothetical protein
MCLICFCVFESLSNARNSQYAKTTDSLSAKNWKCLFNCLEFPLMNQMHDDHTAPKLTVNAEVESYSFLDVSASIYVVTLVTETTGRKTGNFPVMHKTIQTYAHLYCAARQPYTYTHIHVCTSTWEERDRY